jgi:hypothetical protein
MECIENSAEFSNTHVNVGNEMMNEKKQTSTFALLVGAVVLTAFITFVVCHQMLLSPRDKVIKVLSTRLKESERIRETQEQLIEILEQDTEPKPEKQESSQPQD